MKVALVRPPNSGNQVRGVGFYAERLMSALEKLPDLEISWQTYSKNPFVYQKYDIVHFPYFDPFALTIPPVRVSRTVITVHDLIPMKFEAHYPLGKKANVIWPIQKEILKGVDAVITDSKASKKDIEEIIKLPKNKIFVTYLAADQAFKPILSNELKSVKQKFNLPDNFVLYVGGVNWNKNVASLVKACQELKIPLVLVGREFNGYKNLDHTELLPLKEVQDLIKNDKLTTRLGFVETPDLVKIYNLASMYACPSFYEGFGLPVLEALACGTLVISGEGGSLSEIGGKAVFYSGVEVNNLKETINKVLGLTSKEKELKVKESITQASKFSWEQTAKETFDVYNSVLYQ